MNINIRKEEKDDYKAVYQLIKSAFLTAEHSDGTEQDLVHRLRESSAFIPELSLVATLNNTIIGHILFTKVRIGTSEQLALAPLAILPKYQRKGVGAQLIKAGHTIAKKLGYQYSIVLGSDDYYPRFGYVPTKNYNILPPFDVPPQNFMLYPLQDQTQKIEGIVEYAQEFQI